MLFVSHNLQAVAQLTRRSIVMDKGQCVFDGVTGEAINAYNKLRSEGAGVAYNYRAESAVNSNYLARGYSTYLGAPRSAPVESTNNL